MIIVFCQKKVCFESELAETCGEDCIEEGWRLLFIFRLRSG